MSSRADRRSHGGGRTRAAVFLLAALCLIVLCSSPAWAGKKKASAARNARIRIYGRCEDIRGRTGSFQNGCYYDRSGNLITSFDLEDAKPVPRIARLAGKPYLFIGASRTSQFSRAVNDRKTFFYGCSGAGFEWFFRCGKNGAFYPAYQVIRAYALNRPGGTVVVDMGGNDLRNAEAYVSFYTELIKRFPAVTFYFLMPMPYEIGTQDNGNRLAFCERIENEVPGHVLNVFEEVYRRVVLRFPTLDGKHYWALPIRITYEIVVNKMGRSITVNRKTGKVKG